jgi:hypothetical protein
MQDFNSIANQNIKSKFVQREVYCCLTDMVEHLIEAEKLDIYEYLEFYGTLDNGDQYTEQERDEKVEELKNDISDLDWENDAEQITGIEAKIDELENMEFDELPEVFEWWGVSSWFAEKLKEQGQVVIDEYQTSIWGRQTTGQAILLDSVVSRICEGMQILEGQANDWSK